MWASYECQTNVIWLWLLAKLAFLLTIHSITHTHSNDDIFHDSDKISKHVRWSGQNANQKLGRTKCQPQQKVRTKCQSLVGIFD